MTDETPRRLNESVDKIRVETQLKRGEGTRDEDRIKVQVRGDDPADVSYKLAQTLAELRSTINDVRDMQPGADDGEEEDTLVELHRRFTELEHVVDNAVHDLRTGTDAEAVADTLSGAIDPEGDEVEK